MDRSRAPRANTVGEDGAVHDRRGLLLHPQDNVAVVTGDVLPGEEVEVGDWSLQATTGVPCGHKIALRDLGTDSPVVKYGEVIGLTTRPIGRGDHVHVHNLASARLPGASG